MREPAWQGTLHTATVDNPNESKRRIINSTMIVSGPVGSTELISPEEQRDFQQTDVVRRRGYDKPHLQDDR